MTIYRIDSTEIEGDNLLADEIEIEFVYESIARKEERITVAIVIGVKKHDIPTPYSIFKDKENNVWLVKTINSKRYIDLGFWFVVDKSFL